MCGIVGYVGPKPLMPVLIEGLRKLEYRGYDSAGVAVVRNGMVEIRRSAGKLSKLEEALAKQPLDGTFGIGHTRWATHGRPTEENAHPHRDCHRRIVVVHNGIIENYLELKRELTAEGHRFVTETDTEVVAHLVEKESRGDGLVAAVRRALTRLRGLFALVLLSADEPDTIVAVRNGPPIVVGLGDGEFFVASDTPVLEHAHDSVPRRSRDGRRHARRRRRDGFRGPARAPHAAARDLGSGHGRKGRLQALHAQGDLRAAVGGPRDGARAHVERDGTSVSRKEMHIDAAALTAIDRVLILACGTSWHSGLVGKFLVEELARVPVDVDYGSEYRYRHPLVDGRTLAIAITQSGETADTLGALREAKKHGARTLAICNVVGSMATREADGTIYTHAGPEIGVASTKAFTAQLVALALFAIHLGQVRGALDDGTARRLIGDLDRLPRQIEDTLALDSAIEDLARRFHQHRDFLQPRPRYQLSNRARGCAEAEGNLVHPRRGISGRRDEARPDRPHR